MIKLLLISALMAVHAAAQDEPPYPVTAAWFRDRYSIKEWNDTLITFKQQGGDTVVLRAPPIILRTNQELSRDLNFLWCGSYQQSNPAWGTRCYDEAVQELTALGLNVSALVTYQYEENFSDGIMLCPKYDRKINSSRVYYRIVLPGKDTPYNPSAPCDFRSGANVVVLFTSFAGTDPHELLLEVAQEQGMQVYFGLPGAPINFDANLMPSYYAWLDRILQEHHSRYSKMGRRPLEKQRQNSRRHLKLYDSLAGYYGTDECCLGQVTSGSPYVELYSRMGKAVRNYSKKFMISPYINLNRAQFNGTVTNHVAGYVTIAQTGLVDIIAVQEGRGAAKGCYYWPQELHNPVSTADPVLDRAIHYLDPTLRTNITFVEAFTASNREVFSAFQAARNITVAQGIKFDFWLNAEAFEYLRDDLCLPIDPLASGMGELLDRTSKERLDNAISVAGAKVQKIISFAWDSDYTCRTRQHPVSLHEEIMQDLQRPIIANCSFRSYHNLSVVILGFNLDAETQAFTVDWTDTRGRNRTNDVHGYLFELDYGERHNLVHSLQYVMLWDIPEMTLSLAPTGTVKVTAENGRQPCYYSYDLPYK